MSKKARFLTAMAQAAVNLIDYCKYTAFHFIFQQFLYDYRKKPDSVKAGLSGNTGCKYLQTYLLQIFL